MESVIEKPHEIAGQCAVIFGHLFAQKNSGAFALIKVIVHREMVDAAIGTINPILRALCGEDRVLTGNRKVPPGFRI